jgi:hypothetical protein
MSFDTPAGTRGARQPSGPFFRWMNTVMSRRLRRKGGKMMGFNALVLTTVGAKSGAKRTNPVGWFPGHDGSWLIVASAAGGGTESSVVLQHRRASRRSPDRGGRPHDPGNGQTAPRAGA